MAQSKAALVAVAFTMDDVPVALFTDERGGESPRSRAIAYARDTDNATLRRRAGYWHNDACNAVCVNVVEFDEFGQPSTVLHVRDWDDDDDDDDDV